METLWQDLRYAVRMLRKRPGFTFVAMFALALGIGANTTIFSAINALLLHPFPFRDLDRLVVVWQSKMQREVERDSVAVANFLDIRKQSASFEGVAAVTNWSANLTEGDLPERVEGAAVSPQFFNVLGVGPAAGRVFLPEEEKPGSEPVVIISDGLWRRRFGGDKNIVGRVTRINDHSFTVVGVMPPRFDFPKGNVEVWTPLITDKDAATNRSDNFLTVLGRLKPGISVEGAQRELDVLAQRLAEQYPETNTNRTFFVESLRNSAAHGPRPYLLVMLGAVIFVLLIACANVANLQLMRAASRQREIAVRLTLGASRGRLMQQLLTESVLLALGGGAMGLLLAVWAIDAIAVGVPANFSKYIGGWQNLGIDWRVFLFTLFVSTLTGIVFGLVPAWLATKTNLNESLKEGGHTGTTGGGRRGARSLLVISEVALSLMLLVGAGLMMRSFIRLLEVNPGFNAWNVLMMDISLPTPKYTEPEQSVSFYQQLLQKVETLPGVTGAAAVNLVPLEMSDNSTYFSIEGRPPAQPGHAPLADHRVITPGYFDALEIPLLRGRDFTDRDVKGAPPVAIISEKLARKYLPGEDPLGKRVLLGGAPCEIVGVVGDVRYESFIKEFNDERLRPAVYVPHAQNPTGEMAIVVRAQLNPTSLTAAVRKEVQEIDKDQPVYNVRTMPQVFIEAMAPQRLSAFMFAGFALIALLLAAVGIYAVVSYSVAQRTHEIGIRIALGAQGRDILKLVIGQGMVLIVIGVGLGLIGAVLVTRVMASILYGVSATDIATFAGISILLAAVAALACYLPARRATRVDPMVSLRYE